ncbi:hypothetical protein REPUB_Repub11eG0090000 [Reevesia pubescens]
MVNTAYWSSKTVGTGFQVIFNHSGYIYLIARNGSILSSISSNGASTSEFYQRATLEYYGVFRQYVYPKTNGARTGKSMSWSLLSSIPSDICMGITEETGGAACGFNSYCVLGTDQRPRYWPHSDYEYFHPVTEDWCRQACLNDCFCAVAIFRNGTLFIISRFNNRRKKMLQLYPAMQDDSFTPRISDFGLLAKLLKTGQTRTVTGIRRTKGYVAPEWFKSMPITVKVDVYSFGILLLELICCRKNFEQNIKDERQMVLADWVYDCYEEWKLSLIVENDEEALEDIKMVEKFVMIAIWCIQEDPSLRPPMKKVV